MIGAALALMLLAPPPMAGHKIHVSYGRVVVHLAPGDEPNDPESLSDWKVWYTVEVE